MVRRRRMFHKHRFCRSIATETGNKELNVPTKLLSSRFHENHNATEIKDLKSNIVSFEETFIRKEDILYISR